MNKILVIAGKDLRNLFLSPLFYLIAGFCAVAWTFVYYLGIAEFANAAAANRLHTGTEQASLHFVVFRMHSSLVNLFMIFAVSSMSMRMFTEEKKNQTMALLLTSPVTATQITLGKLLAGIVAAWALVAISFLYPLSLRPFAEIQWAPLLCSYLGLLLITGCYVAIGMLASSLTDSTVIAVVMALIFNVMLWFIGALSQSSDNFTVTKVFEHLNVGAHFVGFQNGSISISGIVFFLSVIVLMTFLTQRVVESNRWR